MKSHPIAETRRAAAKAKVAEPDGTRFRVDSCDFMWFLDGLGFFKTKIVTENPWKTIIFIRSHKDHISKSPTLRVQF